ncbi:UV-damaged DNA-binding protein RAD7 [Sporobolomyces koalae]|uniref:UV-damaged DNA-binding protein RAD7 n=1 Tax=Sporobolomyces koalae TaxID=500713 RepID=UPI00317904AA
MPPRRPRRGASNADPNAAGAVYGPRSALTAFLREQGITGPGASFSGRVTRPGEDQEDTSTTATPPPAPAPAPSDSDTTTAVTLVASPSSPRDVSTSASAVASTSASPVASSSTSTTTSSKRKPTKQQEAALKKKQKQEQQKKDEFMLAGKPQTAPKKGRYEHRTPGAIAVCAECGKKFTVSKYTASNPNGPGMLCGACTTESIEDRAAFPGAGSGQPKGKKPVKKKAQKSVEETLYKPVVTLQQSCLSVIGRYINDVEALGDIGSSNLDRVAKIVCKNRALNSDNLKLFLEIGHRELKLYDCTNIKDSDLATISVFCPSLEQLTLNLCGRLDDDVLEQWSKGFKQLRHLTLYAPYLVTANKWKEFFEKRQQDGLELDTFSLRMSSRFNEVSLISLVQTNPNLSTLRLSEIGRFSGESLQYLYPLQGKLRSLDLSRLGTPQGTVLENEHVIELLKGIGNELDELVLDGNFNLTDQVLIKGVKPYCPHLSKLSLSDLGEIEPYGFQVLFSDSPVVREPSVPPQEQQDEVSAVSTVTSTEGPLNDDTHTDPEEGNEDENNAHKVEEPFKRWTSPGLTHLNLHRCTHLTPTALVPLLTHSGSTLEHLSLHSLDELDTTFLFKLAELCPNLRVLDLSFVRSVDNFVVGNIWNHCTKIKTLFVHGNNRVTAEVPRKRDAQLRGLENAIHSEIPSEVIWES